MYNINILSECNDEETRVAIIASVNEFLSKNSSSSFFVNRMKRGKANTPVWNIVSRHENLNNKF